VRIGTFISSVAGRELTGVEALLASARRADAQGFATAWVPHIPWSFDALTALTLAGTVTERIELGTAVVPTFPRHPLALAQQALSTQAATGGRLALGLGPSHAMVIEGMYGLGYESPAAHTREYVEVLDRAFAGTGQVEYDGERFHVHALLDVPDAARPPSMLVAALAPLMLRLAGERTDGTITWMADVRATAEHVVPRITKAAADAGRPPPRIVAGLPVAVCDDTAAGRERAGKLFAVYENIPAYRRMLDRGDAGSPSQVAIVGTEREVEEQLRSHASAGVTDLCAAVFGVGDDHAASRERTHAFLAALAPELD
jgi:F420-dependent oxidoreductase-like protein